MSEKDKNHMWSTDEVRDYLESQVWYQQIELSNGLVTAGKVSSKERLKFIDCDDLTGKSVLDIGCNSGFYCLWAKKSGAKRVVGIEPDEHRLAQAETLSQIEYLDIEYYCRPLSEIIELGQFDVVYCFAVLTEISDLLGAVDILKQLIGYKAYIEIALAKPFIYFSRSPRFFLDWIKKGQLPAVAELRNTKAGWMLKPSLRALRQMFGNDFRLVSLGNGPRYEMVCVERTNKEDL